MSNEDAEKITESINLLGQGINLLEGVSPDARVSITEIVLDMRLSIIKLERIENHDDDAAEWTNE